MNRLAMVAMAGVSLPGLFVPTVVYAQAGVLPAITVTGTREKSLLSETPAAVGVIVGDTMRQDRPSHPAQIMSQIPGVAVAVTATGLFTVIVAPIAGAVRLTAG